MDSREAWITVMEGSTALFLSDPVYWVTFHLGSAQEILYYLTLFAESLAIAGLVQKSICRWHHIRLNPGGTGKTQSLGKMQIIFWHLGIRKAEALQEMLIIEARWPDEDRCRLLGSCRRPAIMPSRTPKFFNLFECAPLRLWYLKIGTN